MSNSSTTTAIAVDPTLQIGAEGPKVKELQSLLNEHLSPRQQVSKDGKFEDKTARAVKVIQYRYFLEQDAIVGAKTWQVLRTRTLIEKPPLKRDNFGQLVGRVQQVLKDGDFYQGTVDQDFGPKTEAAVKLFQKDQQLISDGLIGEQTWLALVELAIIQTAF